MPCSCNGLVPGSKGLPCLFSHQACRYQNTFPDKPGSVLTHRPPVRPLPSYTSSCGRVPSSQVRRRVFGTPRPGRAAAAGQSLVHQCRPAFRISARQNGAAILKLCEESSLLAARFTQKGMQSLLDKEISNNWVVATSLTLAEAKKQWPLGKLNVVFAEGKEPRLVLDSTVCQVNTRCYLPERLSLPVA